MKLVLSINVKNSIYFCFSLSSFSPTSFHDLSILSITLLEHRSILLKLSSTKNQQKRYKPNITF